MTAEQITYIQNINNEFADYCLDLVRRENVGLRLISKKREFVSLLKLTINAIISYLVGTDDDTSFCTESQAQTYVDIINIICKSNHTYN